MILVKKIGGYLFLISFLQFLPIIIVIAGIELLIFHSISKLTKYNLVKTHPAIWIRASIRFFYNISIKLAGIKCHTQISVILKRQK